MSSFKVVGAGTYLPRTKVSSVELDQRLERPKGWCEERSRVRNRHFAEKDETFSFMGAQALRGALAEANLEPNEIDLLISASASCEQPLPYQAAAIHRALGLGDSGIPCFDVGTTCLSFISALDVAALYLQSGRCKRVAIVSSEIPSVGLNWRDAETAPLFGDGAAAVVLQKEDGEAGLIASRLETYSDGYDFCRIRAGATKLNMRTPSVRDEDYLFAMDGRKAFKLVSAKIDRFVSSLMNEAEIPFDAIDRVVPHQASPLALHHMRERLRIPSDKMVDILADHGNQVGASIPIAFHHARKTLKPGANVLLIGTSAGLSIGAAVLRI